MYVRRSNWWRFQYDCIYMNFNWNRWIIRKIYGEQWTFRVIMTDTFFFSSFQPYRHIVIIILIVNNYALYRSVWWKMYKINKHNTWTWIKHWGNEIHTAASALATATIPIITFPKWAHIINRIMPLSITLNCIEWKIWNLCFFECNKQQHNLYYSILDTLHVYIVTSIRSILNGYIVRERRKERENPAAAAAATTTTAKINVRVFHFIWKRFQIKKK